MPARLIALLSLALAAPLGAQRAPLTDLDAFLPRAMAEWGVPGLAVAVVKDDSVVLARGYGVRSIESREPVDENTIFAIGSATKAFTATALAILADEGRLAWRDRVVDRLPGFELADPWRTREIRLRDLITHHSGLPGGRSNLLWFGGRYDRAEIVRRARYIEPTAGLREEFQYQNIMVLAAGQVVSAVAGVSWDQFVQERIFRPLDMNESTTSIRALAGRSNVATPHAAVAGRLRTLPWRNIDNIGPAGSINSSAREMAAWLRLHLAGGAYRGRRVLSEAAVEELRTPQVVLPPSRMGSMDVIHRAGAPTPFFTYGLGWVVFDYRGRRAVWHGGNIDGMSALVAMVPSERLGIVVLTNLNGSVLREVVMLRVFDAYLAPEERRDWSGALRAVVRADEAKRRAADARPAAPAPPSRPLGDFTGRYTDSLLGGLAVREERGVLRFELDLGLSGVLDPAGGHDFRARWDDPGIPVIAASFDGAMARFAFGGPAPAPAAEIDFEGIGRFRRISAVR